MTTDSELCNILEKWQQHTTELHNAINCKHVRLFKYHLAQGTECFKLIQDHIRNYSNINKNDKQDILTTSNQWTSCIESINQWKQEIASELQQVRQRHKTNGKIRNAYTTKGKQLGINVSRKAR